MDAKSDLQLSVDPHREVLAAARPQLQTGVYVRAKDTSGKYVSADLYALDAESVRALLLAKPSEWVNNLVLILLGHQV